MAHWSDEKDIRFNLPDYEHLCTCNLRFLTDDTIDLCLSALRFAHWAKMWLGVKGEYDPDFLLAEAIVENAEVELMSDCSGISQGLQALATAVRSGGGATGSGGSCYGGVVDCLGRYTDDEFLDTAPPGVDPNGQTPPDGFETMEEYRIWKCQAANWIYGWLIGFARGLSGWGSFSITVNSAGALVAALLGMLGVVVFPPAAILAVIAAVVALGALSTGAFVGGELLAKYFEAHKDDLVCELYQSGDASDALLAIAQFVEDGIQSAEMASFLSGLPSGAGAAIGAIFGAVATNSLVAPLFRLVADVVFPNADCSSCEEQSSAHGPWHFDTGAQGWTFEDLSGYPSTVTGEWTDNPPITDPSEGESAGALVNTATRSGNDCYGKWTCDFHDDPILIVEGVTFNFDFYPSGATPQTRGNVVYSDDSYSGWAWSQATPSEWQAQHLPLDAGKYAVQVEVQVSAGSDGVANFVIDNAGFWDVTPE